MNLVLFVIGAGKFLVDRNRSSDAFTFSSIRGA
jgi:hypothetical protein